ncbi:MAG TPA: tetratricopeptide repeat protein, partial [Sumerlaeia bacterium]|nr:tetratricopeptide repeat protein [Sumerlaeia bacterium]
MAAFFMAGKEVTPLQHRIAGLVGATMAGLFGYFVTGAIKIQTEGQLPKWGKVAIQASGGTALFVLVLIWWGSDAAPVKVSPALENRTNVKVDVSESGNAATVAVAGNVEVGAGGSVTIAPTVGLSAEEVSRVVEAAIRRAEEKNAALAKQLQSTSEERERLKRDLAAAVERIGGAGTEESRAALAELRQSGDATGLLEFLKKEDARIESEGQARRKHQLGIKREIAAVAFVTGEMDLSEATLGKILANKPDDIDATNRMGHIQRLRGDLGKAEQSYKRVLELAGEDQIWRANGCGNLGIIYGIRGDLDEAERMHRQALKINEQLGGKEGMAAAYCNLGVIHETRGDLDEAERMHRQSLEIYRQMGGKQGMAAAYGNLGVIRQTRGDLDEAERMHRQSLEIHKQMRSKEGMAIDYCNLGIIHMTRGDLDEAERMYRQSLETHEQLGSKEGMAVAYCNLGVMHRTRRDLDEAERMLRHSLDLYKQIGIPDKIALVQGWIDDLAKDTIPSPAPEEPR